MENVSMGEVLAAFSVLLSVVLLALVWMRTRPQSVEEAMGSFQEVAELAKTAVLAAEQLWLSGKLPKDERFAYAMELLSKEFPMLDMEQVSASIEAGVYWLKTMTAARQPSA